jgi:hypothetical protein
MAERLLMGQFALQQSSLQDEISHKAATCRCCCSFTRRAHSHVGGVLPCKEWRLSTAMTARSLPLFTTCKSILPHANPLKLCPQLHRQPVCLQFVPRLHFNPRIQLKADGPPSSAPRTGSVCLPFNDASSILTQFWHYAQIWQGNPSALHLAMLSHDPSLRPQHQCHP